MFALNAKIPGGMLYSPVNFTRAGNFSGVPNSPCLHGSLGCQIPRRDAVFPDVFYSGWQFLGGAKFPMFAWDAKIPGRDAVFPGEYFELYM